METTAMALKDTLQQLNEKSKEPSLDRAAFLKEWRDAVVHLYDQIREYLQEYINEGSISVLSISYVTISEEALGDYQASMMRLKAGPAVIEIKPIGRMIVGATGRVDLYRQGKTSPSGRVIALRMSYPPETTKWELIVPPKDRSFELMNMRELEASQKRQHLSFDKPNLELAIDRILQ
jgi:hypothetical protein